MGAVYGLDCIQDVFICTLHLLQITHPLNTTENQCKLRKSRALNLNLLIRIFLGKKRKKLK